MPAWNMMYYFTTYWFDKGKYFLFSRSSRGWSVTNILTTWGLTWFLLPNNKRSKKIGLSKILWTTEDMTLLMKYLPCRLRPLPVTVGVLSWETTSTRGKIFFELYPGVRSKEVQTLILNHTGDVTNFQTSGSFAIICNTTLVNLSDYQMIGADYRQWW